MVEEQFFLWKSGAGTRTRTEDLLITNQLLYQLSYAGKAGRTTDVSTASPLVLPAAALVYEAAHADLAGNLP